LVVCSDAASEFVMTPAHSSNAIEVVAFVQHANGAKPRRQVPTENS